MSDVAEGALRRAAEAGIRRIAVPTSFAVGAVNTYLLEDDPLTLVDTGPNWGTSLDELARGLEALGHSIADLELILISHQHLDHFGLTDILARRSGAEVVTLELLAPSIVDYEGYSDRENEFSLRIMAAHGVPDEIIAMLPLITSGFRALGASAAVGSTVRDGDEIRLRDRVLTVHHRPGHSPTDTIFHDASSGMLLAADHLLGHISSNPLVHRPPGLAELGDDIEAVRPQALVTYLESQRRTREMSGVEVVLPGHGDPVTDPVALVDSRLEMHARRVEKIAGLIATEPRTAHGIARALWDKVAVTQAYLTLSEVLGHVDILLNAGRVLREDRDGVVYFVAA